MALSAALLNWLKFSIGNTAMRDELAAAVDLSTTRSAFSSSTGVGYGAGNGGTVAQATDKGTAVALNQLSGQITTQAAALAAGAEVAFTVTNNKVEAGDVPVVAVKSGPATAGTYAVVVSAVAAGSFQLAITNLSAGSLSEALVISFALIKAVSA